MPKQKFALERGGPKRLECSWGAWFRNFKVKLDGNVVGTFANKKELHKGKEFLLPDSSKLNVRLEKSRLSLYRNGKAVPNSYGDPVRKLNTAVGLIYFIAILTAVVGVVSPALQSGSKNFSGSGTTILLVISLGLAGLYAFLGFLVRQRVRVALWLALGLYSIDTVLGLLFVVRGNSLLIFSVVFRFLVLYYLYQGFAGFKSLKQEESLASGGSSEILPELSDVSINQ